MEIDFTSALRRTYLTPRRLHTARILLAWSRDDLAARCGVPAERIARFEDQGEALAVQESGPIKAAILAAGIAFPTDDIAGAVLLTAGGA